MSRTMLLLLCALTSSACGDDGASVRPPDASVSRDGGVADGAPLADGPPRPDAAPDGATCHAGPFGALDLAQVRRVVTLGDVMAGTPSLASSYGSLLLHNDDMRFPEFRGKDLATLLPGVEVVRLDRAAQSFISLGPDRSLFCSCTAAGCPGPARCLDPADARPTLLFIQLDAGDLLAAFFRLVGDNSLADDPTPLLSDFRAQVRAVLAIADDPQYFSRRPAIVVANFIDPTDDSGDLDMVAQMLFPALPFSGLITPAQARRLLGGLNQVIAEEAGGCGGSLVDLHAHFLGHSLFYADAANPNHDAADPTLWLQSIVEPNLRGAHEIRRAIWNTLVPPGISALPSGLPPAPMLGSLPMVPDNGWAKAVVSSDLTMQLPTDFGAPADNVAIDPMAALGAAVANSPAVALGVVGKYVVVDLGAGTAATDGPGDDLLILEQGPMHNSVGEPYRVFAANAPQGPFVQIGDGLGEQSFDLAGSGLASARYIKVMSLDPAVDILRGPGSPYYPGPEIDAIGAVHPGP